MDEGRNAKSQALGEYPEVPVCSMDAAQGLLHGADGGTYAEVTTNIWMRQDQSQRVAYLGTGRHGGGIILRPLFIREGASWKNATTGAVAPAQLMACLEGGQQPAEACSAMLQEPRCPKSPDCPSPAPDSDPLEPVRVLASMTGEDRCEALVRIAESFSWSSNLRDVLQNCCQTMADLFACSQAHMHLISADKETFMRRASAVGNTEPLCYRNQTLIPPTTHMSANVGRLKWLMAKSQPIIMDYEHPHFRDEIPETALAFGMRSAVSIPLIHNDQVLGIVSLVYRAKVEWSEEDCDYLVAVGRLAGSLIKRLFDTKKSAELQILNERKLLSTEIHENVSSLLGAVSINAAAALEAFKDGDEDLARQDLERLEVTAAETMRILRDEMFSLRINLEDTDTLIEGMQGQLENFQRNWGVEAELAITGSHLPVVVSTQASLQLTRILNECLSNVLRHSKATKVWVEVRSEDRFVSMRVQDNGCGFDVNRVNSDHFGLKIMKERAHAAGGRFSVSSGSGGTIVNVEIPRRQAAMGGGMGT